MEELIVFNDNQHPLDQRVDIRQSENSLVMIFRACGGGYNRDYNLAFTTLTNRIRRLRLDIIRLDSAVNPESRPLELSWPEDYDSRGGDGFSTYVRSRMSKVGSGAQGKILIEIDTNETRNVDQLIGMLLGGSTQSLSQHSSEDWREDHELVSAKSSALSGMEGRIQHHLRAERVRDRSLPKQKLNTVLEKEGAIHCEVCGVDWQAVFGTSAPIIDCHHLIPLGSHDEEVVTSLDDLALVCPTCHRALHRMDDPSDLSSLRELFTK